MLRGTFQITFSKDLKLSTTTELAKITHKRFHQNLNTHTNLLISQMFTLTLPKNPPCKLKRKWCRDQLKKCNQWVASYHDTHVNLIYVIQICLLYYLYRL
uniref:Uncharacterized protein n=1 Tax=Sipha flava TaxID=143950 RepID=A0A2S2QTW5_9HEMI